MQRDHRALFEAVAAYSPSRLAVPHATPLTGATCTISQAHSWARSRSRSEGGFAFPHDGHESFAFIPEPVVSTGDKARTGWMVGGGLEIALEQQLVSEGRIKLHGSRQ